MSVGLHAAAATTCPNTALEATASTTTSGLLGAFLAHGGMRAIGRDGGTASVELTEPHR